MTHTLWIDGKSIAERLRNKLKERVETLELKPSLHVILVGEDPASMRYIELKEKAANEIGIGFTAHRLNETVTTEELLMLLERLNTDPLVHGIIVQLPLPAQLDRTRILGAINPNKDVDGFHPTSVARLLAGEPSLVSPVALAVMKLLEATKEPLVHKTAALVMSPTFAAPLLHLLSEQGANVTQISPDDPEVQRIASTSDILVVGVGRPEMIKRSWLKSEATAIDVGTTFVEGKLKGDVDRADADGWVRFASPVPGGVGPLTVAFLLANVVAAAIRSRQRV